MTFVMVYDAMSVRVEGGVKSLLLTYYSKAGSLLAIGAR